MPIDTDNMQEDINSVPENKAERPEDPLNPILISIDTVFKDKFGQNRVDLTMDLTKSQLDEINQRIESSISVWNSTFAEYTHFHHQRIFEVEGTQCMQEWEKFLSKAQHKYQAYASGNGPKWTLSLNGVTETPDLIDFIKHQLQEKRLGALILAQTLSQAAIDSILEACQQSSLRRIYFTKEQSILDYQARTLLKCLKNKKIKEVSNLNGKDLTDETAEQFLLIPYIYIMECSFFSKRVHIKYNLRSFSDLEFAENYQSSEIQALTQQLIDCTDKKINLRLNSSFHNPEWGRFFAKVLASKTQVEELDISLGSTFSEEVFSALLAALEKNTSLTKIDLVLEEQERMTQALNALATHPRLSDLSIGGNCLAQGPSFYQLLRLTKNLKSLNLNRARRDENTMADLAAGIETNTSLEHLYAIDNFTLTKKNLRKFAQALSYNKILRTFVFKLGNNFEQDMYDFIRVLEAKNHSLTTCIFDAPNTNSMKANARFIVNVMQRNQEIVQEQRQNYVETAIVLFQALRQPHKNLSHEFMVNALLAFLRPLPSIASFAQTKQCTDLLRDNLQARVWNTKGSSYRQTYCIGELGKISMAKSRVSIFQRWPILKAEDRTEYKLEESRNTARDQLKTHLRLQALEEKPLSQSGGCTIS